MGKDVSFCCKTCKRNYLLGYGSYSSWLTGCAKTLEEYDKLNDDYKNISKNKNYRECLRLHDGHDYFTWSSDNFSIHHGKLIFNGAYKDETEIENFNEYKQINLQDFTPEIQIVEWVDGFPIHNNVRDECCPDFSCCNGNISEKSLRQKFKELCDTNNVKSKYEMLGMFLARAISDHQKNKKKQTMVYYCR